jgi:chromosome segregation ATPase
LFSTTGDERRMEELEAKALGALDLYFETRRREVEENKKNAGSGLEAYEEVRRQLAEAEEDLVELRRRAAELQVEAVDTIVGGGEVSDLAEGVSELQQEIHDLAEAEKAARKRKEDAEETLRRVELDYGGDLGEAGDRVAAFALQQVEEIDGFKERLDQRFAEGRTSVLGAAN